MIDGFYCSCRNGFYGELCEMEADECISQPCQHEGVCQDLDNAYVCICQSGYAGVNCEVDCTILFQTYSFSF